jgi:hypothetical protein
MIECTCLKTSLIEDNGECLGDHSFIVNDEDDTICIRRLIDPRSGFALDCHTADLDYATMHNAPPPGRCAGVLHHSSLSPFIHPGD